MPAPQYNGIPSQIAQAAQKTISSSTNATPIVITTTAAHGLSDGDEVEVSGHATNTAANGIWRVIVLTSTTFQLLYTGGGNSTGNGVGGASGNVDLLTSGTTAIIGDGLPRDAASYNVPLETLLDRSALSLKRLFGAKLAYKQTKTTTADDTFSPWCVTTINAPDTWEELDANGGGGGTPVNTRIAAATDLAVVDTDWFEVEFGANAITGAGAGSGFGFALFAHIYDYGTSPSFASAVILPGSSVLIGNSVTAAPLTLRAKLPVSAIAALTRGKAIRFYVAARNVGGSGTPSVQLVGDVRYFACLWR